MQNDNDFIWEILESYFKTKGMAQHQLESFNDFLTSGIQRVVDTKPIIEFDIKDKKYTLYIGQVFIDNPCVIDSERNVKYIYPNEARIKNINYEGTICLNFIEKIEEGEDINQKTYYRIPIAKIPIMLRSVNCNLHNLNKQEKIDKKECIYDHGGYFIIKGNEKVVIPQKRGNYNQIYTYLSKKVKDKYCVVTETRSISEETTHSVVIKAMLGFDDKTLHFSLPYLSNPVPMGIVFKALGFTDDDDIFKLIGMSNIPKAEKYLKLIVRKDLHTITTKDNKIKQIKTQKDALKYLARYNTHISSNIKDILDTQILLHLGTTHVTYKDKAIFLGYMVNRMLHVALNMRTNDDKDNIANKRVESTGILFTEIFRSLYKRWLDKVETQLKINQNISAAVLKNMDTISSNIRKCMATGNWGVKQNTYTRTGVVQILSRKNYIDMLSHLKRVVIPISKEGKNSDIRQIHPSQIFFECPSETPEGQQAGIVTNLSLTTNITNKLPIYLVREIIENHDNFVYDIKLDEIYDHIKILLNGILVGFTDDADIFVKDMREKRRIGSLDKDVSIVFDRLDEEIRIFCDEGRFIRPVFKVENGKLLVKNTDIRDWDILADKGYIVFLDPGEIEYSNIVTEFHEITEDTEYCEIHPVLMFGLCASLIPFGNFSQSPRLCYQSSMCKQALSLYATSHNFRADVASFVLSYPQKPIVSSKIGDIIGYNKLPCGINVVLAIACMDGWNQEDSIVLNKSSIERGLFTVTSYKTIVGEEKKNSVDTNEEIKLPEEDIRSKYNYSYLDENGIVKKGIPVKRGDVIIGKVLVKYHKTGDKEYIDTSIIIKVGEEGTVDKVLVNVDPDGFKIVKVVIQRVKVPEVGDKFCTRSAQKGTVGAIYSQEDLPFNPQTGMTPDIILNPHALPSRMTINLLLETAMAKIGISKGEFQDCTSFNQNSDFVNNILSELESCGFEKHGWERLYSGTTGEMINSPIFMGPNYYQRLKHLVSEKMHCLTYDHEILTSFGWKTIENLTLIDKVATLIDGKLVYTQPTKIHLYKKYKGNLYYVTNDDVDLIVTEEHRMFVSFYSQSNYSLIPVKNLIGKNVKYCKNAIWDGDNNYINWQKYLPGCNFFSNEIYIIAWLKFVGYLYKSFFNSDVVNINNLSMYDKIIAKRQLDILEIDYKIIRDGIFNDIGVMINENQNIYTYVKIMVRMNSFPPWMFLLNRFEIGIFIDCLIDYNNKIRCKSCKLIDQLQQLSLHAGYSMDIQKEDDVFIGIVSKNVIYNTTSKINVIYTKNTPVWCVSVPSEVFFVRRNGKCCWTGNSRYNGQVTSLFRQPIEGFKALKHI